MKRVNEKRLNLIWWALGLSLLVHVGLLYLQLDEKTDTAPQDYQPIELSDIPPEVLKQYEEALETPEIPVSKEKQIVESEKADNEEIDPNAKFLSDKNQRVEEQTKAPNVDDFRKTEGTGLGGEDVGIAPPGDPELEGPPDDASELDVADSDGQKPNNKGTVRDWRNLTLKDLSVGGKGGMAGATDDLLDDIKTGSRTILSTREFRYFSYYHRIKELLRQFWKPTVERKLMSVWSRGGAIKQTEMTTKLLVLLDTQGNIEKISRVTSSGIDEIDDAAIEAFRQAGPFPNPPKGIVDADGFVRIRWDFILKAQASPAIQFRQVGQR